MAAHLYLPILAAIAVTTGLIMGNLPRPAVLSTDRPARRNGRRRRFLPEENVRSRTN